MRKLIAGLSIALAAMTAPPRAAEPSWHITATLAESCSCTIACPCNFGGEPNRNPCEGNRLIAIKSGHYEDRGSERGDVPGHFHEANLVEDLCQR